MLLGSAEPLQAQTSGAELAGDIGTPQNAAEPGDQQAAVPIDPDFAPHEHPFGPWSILPPALAIILAIVTRRIVPSLMLGILCGAVVLQIPEFNSAEPGAARYWELISRSVASWGEDFLWTPLTDSDLLSVFMFTMLMGAMVAVAHASGGMYGLVDKMSPLAKTRRGGQMTGWGLGMVVFFDDYANSLLLGNTLRPTMDRLKISREKLAYIVDSTSAPIASIALISTWVAIELEYISDGYQELGLALTQSVESLRFQAFMKSIPYRFYAIMALVFVAIISWMGRDFGPMLKAERRAAKRRDGGGDQTLSSAGGAVEEHAKEISADEAAISPAADIPRRWINAVLPIMAIIGVTLWLIIVTGTKQIGADEPLLDRFQNGDSYLALRYGALAGLLVAALSAWVQRLMTWKQIGVAAFAGAKMILPALVILWLASGIKSVTQSDNVYSLPEQVTLVSQAGSFVSVPDDTADNQGSLAPKLSVMIEQQLSGALTMTVEEADNAGQIATKVVEASSRDDLSQEQAALFDAAYDRDRLSRSGSLATADYVGNVIRDHITPFWMPTIVFLLAAAVAFSTGTSWGTMGILTPLVVSVTYKVIAEGAGADADPNVLVYHPILMASIGSVLAGAIFGDHCSPISDTTVLSSVASGCNHIAHVRTQMPYAMLVALLVIPLGTIPAGWGIAWYGALGCILLCCVAAVGIVYLVGKRVDEDDAETSAMTGSAQDADSNDVQGR
ncbi:MAG: hypothetical protein MPJ50_04175 [Pirellulales bacterium]|nr:hypothetical protein [Pirellulales bacterium]